MLLFLPLNAEGGSRWCFRARLCLILRAASVSPALLYCPGLWWMQQAHPICTSAKLQDLLGLCLQNPALPQGSECWQDLHLREKE